MTIRSRGGNQFEGLSTDTKPTDLPKYSRILETDTNNEYILNSSLVWVQIGAGSNTGEANTASYPGTGGISLTLTKSGAVLPFKGIAVGTSGNITATDDTTNKNVVLDLNTFLELSAITIPSNPSGAKGRVYIKTIDSNNEGVFALIKKGGSYVEFQIL